MKPVQLNQATESLATYAKKLRRGPLVVVKKGKPVAALVTLANSDWESISLANNPKFLRMLQASRDRQAREGGITADEMRRRLGLPEKKRRGAAIRKKK